MARLIAALMRHAAYHQPSGVPSAHLPHPLTPTGEDQAREGAAAFMAEAATHGWRIHPVIDASSLLRGWQTAEIVATVMGGDTTVDQFDALTERSVGSAANLTVEEIEAVCARDPRLGPLPDSWKSRSDFRLPFPGAESLIEAGARVARHLRDRMAALADEGYSERTVKLFVGHGASFRHAAAALGALTPDEARARSMFHARPVFLAAPSDGPWRHVGGAWKMRRGAQESPD
jgi:broad specificity phosphatase PhoE